MVQKFTPMIRRVKCVRCGGDWDMHDGLRMFLEWTPHVEQFWRHAGFEILEPLPAWRSFPVELTWAEIWRAIRWPGVLAMTLNSIFGYALKAAAIDVFVQIVVLLLTGCGLGTFLGRHALDRAYERKCNSLEA